MWHIPLSASEPSLLYAAETFEQFENLLHFFNSLDDEETHDKWKRLGSDLENIRRESEKEPQEIYEDNIIIMESAATAAQGSEVPFEIEEDMRVVFELTKPGNASVKNYVESIAARYPLLGTAVLQENSRKAVERTAAEALKISLKHRKVHNWAYLAMLLTMIQYAKDWDRTENSGLWAYIAEQFGYKDSPQIYNVLTTAVKTACQSYNRLFVVDLNGDNNYYSTVLAHALSPRKSFYSLCEFLLKFYGNNLDCSVYSDDPAIGHMTDILRDRFQGTAISIEQGAGIPRNTYDIQAGLKALITTRPCYMKHFLTKILQKMGTLLDGTELPGREYPDILLTQWYISKLTKPSASTDMMVDPLKRNVPTHKRTTEIAFSYGKIRVEYILDDDNEPSLRIPSIRLFSLENPVIIIRSSGKDLYRHTIGIYGNDYAATSEEVTIPLSDICDADFTRLEAEILLGEKQIFTSGSGLRAKTLLFKDKKLQTGKTIEEGNYTLFAPKSVNIKFQGNVSMQRRSYFEQLLDIYICDEVSIFADGSLICCSKPSEGSLQFRLPQTQLEYVYRADSYPIYSRAEFALTAVGTAQNCDINATLQNGESLSIECYDDLWLFAPPEKDGGYNVTLSDADSGRILDEIKFYITDNYTVHFDRLYYLETSEDGNVTVDINGRHFELPLMGFGSKAKIPFGSGELHIKIPRIQLLLDGNPLPTKALWQGEILPNSTLRVLCSKLLPVSLFFGESQIPYRNSFGGYDFLIGNAVQAYDENRDKVSVNLFAAGVKLPMFDVVFKMSVSEPPRFNLNGNTLMWLNSQTFIGDKRTLLKFIFSPKHGNPISLAVNCNERVLSENFPSESEQYQYQVFAQNETSFGTVENLLSEGSVIFGDKASVIFRGKVLHISKVLMDGDYTEIRPVYADEIVYLGTENLGYTDLSGDYAHYTAKLFFMTKNGRRYFTDLNPVDIYLVSENANRLHITFDCGEGLFVDKSSSYGFVLYQHMNPPPKLAKYFFIPDFFEYILI